MIQEQCHMKMMKRKKLNKIHENKAYLIYGSLYSNTMTGITFSNLMMHKIDFGTNQFYIQ